MKKLYGFAKILKIKTEKPFKIVPFCIENLVQAAAT